MTAVEAGSFPSVFKEGCAINKKIPFLSGADGVVSKFQQNKVRYADIYKEATRRFTNHPVCAAEERDLLLTRSHPSLKTEGNELASTALREKTGEPCGLAGFLSGPRTAS